jgi:hypothetical protein
LIGIGAAEGGTAVDGALGAAGWVLGYSPEYATLEGNPTLLASLVDLTGGRALDIGDAGSAAAVFEHNLIAAPAAQPVWPWLALAAVLLLPLDVAARRLALTRRDWARAWGRITNYELRIKNEEEIAGSERTEGMERLMRAKERAEGELRMTNYELGMEKEASQAESVAAPIEPQTPATADSPAEAASLEEESLAARLRRRRGL